MPPRSWPATQITAPPPSPGRESPGRPRRQVHADGDQGQEGGQHHRGGQPLMGQECRAMLADRGQPGRLGPRSSRRAWRAAPAGRGSRAAAPKRPGWPTGRARALARPGRPRPGPRRTGPPDQQCPGAPAPVARPQQDRQQRVEDHRARGAATGLAVPVSIPPSPSPNHHTPRAQTIDAPSATLTVGRQAMPRASRSWMVAKATLGHRMLPREVGVPEDRPAARRLGCPAPRSRASG